jgi:hypothetical protein
MRGDKKRSRARQAASGCSEAPARTHSRHEGRSGTRRHTSDSKLMAGLTHRACRDMAGQGGAVAQAWAAEHRWPSMAGLCLAPENAWHGCELWRGVVHAQRHGHPTHAAGGNESVIKRGRGAQQGNGERCEGTYKRSHCSMAGNIDKASDEGFGHKGLKGSKRHNIEQLVGMPRLQQKACPPWSLVFYKKNRSTHDTKADHHRRGKRDKRMWLGAAHRGLIDMVQVFRRTHQGRPRWLSYGPPWAHYLGGYQDRLLGGPLGLPGLRYTASEGVEHKDYTGVVLG